MAGRRWRAASAMRGARLEKVKVSGSTIRPPPDARACASIAASISLMLPIDAALAVTPSVGAEVSMKLKYCWAKGAVSGLNRTATRVTGGAISLSISSHLPASEYSNPVNPVALPPGRARLPTKPVPTGAGFPQERLNRGRVAGKHHLGFEIDEFLCNCLHPIEVARRPAIVGAKVAS